MRLNIDIAELQAVKKCKETRRKNLQDNSDEARKSKIVQLYEAEKLNEKQKKEVDIVTKIFSDKDRKDYFYSSGVDAWWEPLKDNTFFTTFVDLTSSEKYDLWRGSIFWNEKDVKETLGDLTFKFYECKETNEDTEKTNSVNPLDDGDNFNYEKKIASSTLTEEILISDLMEYDESEKYAVENGTDIEIKIQCRKRLANSLLKRNIDNHIKNFHNESAFLKLTTRSPKDSKLVLKKAKEKCLEVWDAENKTKKGNNFSLKGCEIQNIHPTKNELLEQNARWITLSEQVRLASKVRNGTDCLRLLLDSRRVFDDITGEIELLKMRHAEAGTTTESNKLGLVLRSFNDKVTPSTEFRGFVWNRKFTCAGQYFNPLFFPHLIHKKERIKDDLIHFYNNVMRPKLENSATGKQFLEKIPCFMMDLVWLEEDNEGRMNESSKTQVFLTEINPFDGWELGTIRASTGLFDWDKDRKTMMGEGNDHEFELRINERVLDFKKMGCLSSEWKQIVNI